FHRGRNQTATTAQTSTHRVEAVEIVGESRRRKAQSRKSQGGNRRTEIRGRKLPSGFSAESSAVASTTQQVLWALQVLWIPPQVLWTAPQVLWTSPQVLWTSPQPWHTAARSDLRSRSAARTWFPQRCAKSVAR